MLAQSIGLILIGGFGLGVRPGILKHNNVIHLQDNKNYKYHNIKGFNYLFFSGVEYSRNPTSSNVPLHNRYKFSLRPLVVYHNNQLIYHDMFASQ